MESRHVGVYIVVGVTCRKVCALLGLSDPIAGEQTMPEPYRPDQEPRQATTTRRHELREYPLPMVGGAHETTKRERAWRRD